MSSGVSLFCKLFLLLNERERLQLWRERGNREKSDYTPKRAIVSCEEIRFSTEV